MIEGTLKHFTLADAKKQKFTQEILSNQERNNFHLFPKNKGWIFITAFAYVEFHLI